MSFFNITLVGPSVVAPMAEGPSGLDFESVVMDLCSVLAEADCSFGIAGFGQAKWPVDVRYDLSTLVEQLPETLSRIKARESAEIDLYGQGTERTLAFSFGVGGDWVTVTCLSRTGWIPVPAQVELEYSKLLEMLESVAFEFAKSLRLVWPQCVELAPFSEWLGLR